MRLSGRASLLAAAVFVSTLSASGQTQAVTIPFPRRGSAAVGLTNGPMRIESVILKGRPVTHLMLDASSSIIVARRHRNDRTLLRWVFRVANSGRRDWHARIRVRVYSADDRLLASNDREGEVNARDWKDQITVWTRIRTLDYPRADHLRIEASFFPG